MIRTAVEEDAPELAATYLRAREAAMPWLPNLHTTEQDVAFFRNRVIPNQTVEVAIRDDRIAGLIAYEEDWVNQLYLDPDYWRMGIGTALLKRSLKGVPSRQLWVFQQNHAAQKFYTRHGFKIVEQTDGSNNMETCPDFRMEWRA